MKSNVFCEDREQAASSLANRLHVLLADAIAQRGSARIVVSGGTSPARLFELMSTLPLDWSKVSVVPSDERLVPMTSNERNEAMVRSTLLTANAADASLVSLVSDPDAPADCEQFANQNLEQLSGAFDAVVLGMGEDGHTASLFPDSASIKEALASNHYCVIQNVPSQQRTRISLTPKALLNSANVFLLVFGESKLKVLQTAEQDGPVEQYPVRVVLHQELVPVATYWAP